MLNQAAIPPNNLISIFDTAVEKGCSRNGPRQNRDYVRVCCYVKNDRKASRFNIVLSPGICEKANIKTGNIVDVLVDTESRFALIKKSTRGYRVCRSRPESNRLYINLPNIIDGLFENKSFFTQDCQDITVDASGISLTFPIIEYQK